MFALVVVDSLSIDLVTPQAMPSLSNLSHTAHSEPFTTQAVMSSSTYPNHASLITGEPPGVHQIHMNVVYQDGEFVPAERVGPQCSTLVERVNESGLRTVSVVGDQHLIGAMGLGVAEHWPENGELGEDVSRCEFGYAMDSEVADQVESLDLAEIDFLFVHLNEVDTASHLGGPGSTRVQEAAARADKALTRIVEALRPVWNETVIGVVSDHSQEKVDALNPIMLHEQHEQVSLELVNGEGGAALVAPGPSLDDLVAVDGVGGGYEAGNQGTVLWAEEGRVFWPWIEGLTVPTAVHEQPTKLV